jgi:hypothetical protein
MALSDTLESLQILGDAAMAAADVASANTGNADAQKYADTASAAWGDYRAALAAAEREHPDVCFACEMPADRCPCHDAVEDA